MASGSPAVSSGVRRLGSSEQGSGSAPGRLSLVRQLKETTGELTCLRAGVPGGWCQTVVTTAKSQDRLAECPGRLCRGGEAE